MPILREHLLTHIPMTAAMGVEVCVERPERVVLAAPLAPNINHQGTAFGGSLEYRAAIDGELSAVCEFDNDSLWQKTIEQLGRRGRARLELHSRLEHAGETAVRFSGTFVLLDAGETDRP